MDPGAPDLRALHGAPLALIRPDQVIGWRGDGDVSARDVCDRVLGRG